MVNNAFPGQVTGAPRGRGSSDQTGALGGLGWPRPLHVDLGTRTDGFDHDLIGDLGFGEMTAGVSMRDFARVSRRWNNSVGLGGRSNLQPDFLCDRPSDEKRDSAAHARTLLRPSHLVLGEYV